MNHPFIVIMGVSGCGKTTIASSLAEKLGGRYLEGDSFHPPENKEKMGAGIPLTDEDRWPWFDELRSAASEAINDGKTAVLSCSALKQVYRDYLFQGFDEPRLVYLEGSFDLIKSRMDARNHEYMTSTLLKSQFDTLEEPQAEANCLAVSIELSPEEILERIESWLSAAEVSNG